MKFSKLTLTVLSLLGTQAAAVDRCCVPGTSRRLKLNLRQEDRVLEEENCACTLPDPTCDTKYECKSMEVFCDMIGDDQRPSIDLDPCTGEGNTDKCCDVDGNEVGDEFKCEPTYGEVFCPMPPTPSPTGAGGDPHFKTFGGEWFDYHGICDLVLMKNPAFDGNTGMNMHIRTKERFGYSYIEAAAVQIGDNTLEVNSWGHYMVNGVSTVPLPLSFDDKYTVSMEQVNEKMYSFLITLNTDTKETIKISTFKDMVSITLENASQDNFSTSHGLMGQYPDGRKVARDGQTLMEKDLNAFGQEWQVLSDQEPMLFQFVRTPQGPKQKCIIPRPPSKEEARRRLQEGVSTEAAELACAHYKTQEKRDMCAFDVMAMNDLEVADANGVY